MYHLTLQVDAIIAHHNYMIKYLNVWCSQRDIYGPIFLVVVCVCAMMSTPIEYS